MSWLVISLYTPFVWLLPEDDDLIITWVCQTCPVETTVLGLMMLSLCDLSFMLFDLTYTYEVASIELLLCLGHADQDRFLLVGLLGT